MTAADWDTGMNELHYSRGRSQMISRPDGKSQVRQCLGFCTADFRYSLVYESVVQKPKHCLTLRLLTCTSSDDGSVCGPVVVATAGAAAAMRM